MEDIGDMDTGWGDLDQGGHTQGRQNRTISETTYVTEDGQEADLRVDVGEVERDHFNVGTSSSISEDGNRTVMDNAHVDY